MSEKVRALSFLWRHRWWWLIPMIAVVLIFVILAILFPASPVAPFLYLTPAAG